MPDDWKAHATAQANGTFAATYQMIVSNAEKVGRKDVPSKEVLINEFASDCIALQNELNASLSYYRMIVSVQKPIN